MATIKEKQRKMRAQLNQDRGVHWQCTSCDIVGYTHDDPVFSVCRQNNHTVTKMVGDGAEELGIDDYADIVMQKYSFKTLDDTDEVLYYNAGAYVEGGEVVIKSQCEAIVEKCSTYIVNEVTNKIRRRTYCSREDFDSNGGVNIANGVLDLWTSELKPYRPDILTRKRLDVKYEPSARCPNILKFLRECLPDPKSFFSVLEHAASLLVLNLKLEKAYMYIGDGANGKSTWFEVLISFIGRDNLSSISIHDLINHRFAKAGLDGKIANIFAEITNQEIKELSVFKMIVSGDLQEAEKKGKDRFRFTPRARHFFSANRLPKLEDETDAVFRRFDIIEWPQQFRDTVREQYDSDTNSYRADPRLVEQLCTNEELSGLLNTLIPIARKLYKRRHLLHAKSIEDMKDLWQEQSDSVTKFHKACLVADSNWMMLRTELYTRYRRFCRTLGKTVPEPERNFYKKLQDGCDCHFKRLRYNKGENPQHVVIGLRFREELNITVGKPVEEEHEAKNEDLTRVLQ